LLAGTKILLPKYDEELLGVKTNKNREVVCTKNSTREHSYFEVVRAHPTKVKFIPPKEAPKLSMVSFETA
jgi:hypothetical protein